MRRVTIILGGLLAAQLVLAAALHLGDANRAAAAEGSQQPLASFERSAIDAVRIEGGDGNTLRVARGDDGWQLPGSDGFPARKQSVERLLRDLSGFEQRLPVARSASAHERFKVGAQSYVRRVTLLAGGEPQATVLFGSSAGTGRVYARAEGQDMVYEVRFPLWHAAVDASKWHDTSLVGVEPSSVVQARLPGFLVRRDDSGQGWKVVADGNGGATSADPGAAAKLVRQLAQPGFQRVARASPPDAAPALAYTLTTREGREVRYRYYGASGDGQPRLFRADQPWAYTVKAKQLARAREGGAEDTACRRGRQSGGGREGEWRKGVDRGCLVLSRPGAARARNTRGRSDAWRSFAAAAHAAGLAPAGSVARAAVGGGRLRSADFARADRDDNGRVTMPEATTVGVRARRSDARMIAARGSRAANGARWTWLRCRIPTPSLTGSPRPRTCTARGRCPR
ncbi:MAG: DUF4340 domain-containing protein [Halofilum sp. (in: g-proteobacteria)]|nr:DUF4340 domain-containing protein [Halofilum sp. (in: g-proteobacteria)]